MQADRSIVNAEGHKEFDLRTMHRNPKNGQVERTSFYTLHIGPTGTFFEAPPGSGTLYDPTGKCVKDGEAEARAKSEAKADADAKAAAEVRAAEKAALMAEARAEIEKEKEELLSQAKLEAEAIKNEAHEQAAIAEATQEVQGAKNKGK